MTASSHRPRSALATLLATSMVGVAVSGLPLRTVGQEAGSRPAASAMPAGVPSAQSNGLQATNSNAGPSVPPSNDVDLTERDRLWQEAQDALGQQDSRTALARGAKVLELERQLLGQANDATAETCEWLIGVALELNDFKLAQHYAAELLTIELTRWGESDYRTRDARRRSDKLLRLSQEPEVQQRAWRQAEQQRQEAWTLYREYTDRYEPAQQLAGTARDAFAKLWGADDEDVQRLDWLIALCDLELGQIPQAIDRLAKLAEVNRRVLGADHPTLATTLYTLSGQLMKQRQYAEAERRLREALAIRVKLYGENHDSVIAALRRLAELRLELNDPQQSLELCQRAADACYRLHQDQDIALPRLLALMAQAYERLPNLAKAEAIYRQVVEMSRKIGGEASRDYATSLYNLAHFYEGDGRYHLAAPLFEESLRIYESTGAANDLSLLKAHERLCLFWLNQYNTQQASAALDKLLKHVQSLDAEHIEFHVKAKQLQGKLLDAQGDVASAEAKFREALQTATHQEPLNPVVVFEAREALADFLVNRGLDAADILAELLQEARQVFGEKSPEVVATLHSISVYHAQAGNLQEVEKCLQQCLQIVRETEGEQSLSFVNEITEFAMYLLIQGDDTQAEPILAKACDSLRQVVGSDRPEYVNALHPLVSLYLRNGDTERGRPLIEQAQAIVARTQGPQSSAYADWLDAEAFAAQLDENYSRSRQLWEQVLAIRRATEGDDTLSTAKAWEQLAFLDLEQGDYSAAEQKLLTAIKAYSQPGNLHSDGLRSCQLELSRVRLAQGDATAASALALQTIDRELQQARSRLGFLSERQKLEYIDGVRHRLDTCLSICLEAGSSPSDLYARVLNWKGLVASFETTARQLRQQTNTAPLFEQLTAVDRQLATLSFTLPSSEGDRIERRRQQANLLTRREALERELATITHEYRQRTETEELSPQQLIDELPPHTALVDIVDYWHTPNQPQADEGNRLVAFVLTPQGPLQVVSLGSSDELDELIGEWRGLRRETTAEVEAEHPGMALRQRLWLPISKHLAGSETVLISPDGPLNRLSLVALPGEQPGTFLIEEIAIAVLPVPQLLPRLTENPRVALSPDAAPSVLLVGNVNYGGEVGKPTATRGAEDWVPLPPAADNAQEGDALRGDALPKYSPLPASKEEIEQLAGLVATQFRSAPTESLSGDAATEEALRQAMQRHAWLHVATHGFFAPAKLTSVLKATAPDAETKAYTTNQTLTAFAPGLLSGIVLAGANNTRVAGRDDGILTAMEVSSLPLNHVELVVLSACDTGLGRIAGGEGVLGLQRAFQQAGARTVVTSLWKVPDRQTNLLMQRFYSNLWERRLPKLAALREAQIWLLRGADGALDPEEVTVSEWAAFTLSGDWH